MKFIRRKCLPLLLSVLVLAVGVAALPALAGTGSKTFSVKVTAKGNQKEKSLKTGQTLQLVVRSGKKKISSGKVTFSSSKKKVASVSKAGLVTAKKEGTAVITVLYKKKQANIMLTVKAPAVSAVSDPNAKTIRNYLRNALIPVGKVLYIWGGGWTYSNIKGIPATMTSWFKNQNASYDYHKYNDLTVGNRQKGFDCSGYVGWCAYQVMHKKSGEVPGYTVVSGEVGGQYKKRGWGSLISHSSLAAQGYVLKPGDIGYDDGHVFIVAGQCKDKSVVVFHSTPQAGVQIAGTATPGGNHNSQAAALAKQYMQKYYASSCKRYPYSHDAGHMIPKYEYFRWNRSTLADPEGYMNMTADQILKDLFK